MLAGRYTIKHKLYNTLYGDASLAIDQNGSNVIIKASGREYADKFVTKNGNKKTYENVHTETEILNKLKDPEMAKYVCQFVESFQDGQYYYTVLEYLPGKDLYDFLKMNNYTFAETEAKDIFRQIIVALLCLHKKNIAHLDISVENVIIDENNRVKLIDFGSARLLSPEEIKDRRCKFGNVIPGKMRYISPELVWKRNIDVFLHDAYSCGVLLYMLLCCKYPYKAVDDNEFNIFWSGEWTDSEKYKEFSGSLSADAIDLISHLICPESSRYTLEQVLSHKWLQESLESRPVVVEFIDIRGSSSLSEVTDDRSPSRQEYHYTRDVSVRFEDGMGVHY